MCSRLMTRCRRRARKPHSYTGQGPSLTCFRETMSPPAPPRYSWPKPTTQPWPAGPRHGNGPAGPSVSPEPQGSVMRLRRIEPTNVRRFASQCASLCEWKRALDEATSLAAEEAVLRPRAERLTRDPVRRAGAARRGRGAGPDAPARGPGRRAQRRKGRLFRPCACRASAAAGPASSRGAIDRRRCHLAARDSVPHLP